MLHSDPNPFERETGLLEHPKARQETKLVFEAAELLAMSKWAKVLDKV
jgi:hypothetical protein